MDKESLELVKQAYVKAKCIISSNKEVMDTLIDTLLTKRTLYGDEFLEIIDGKI